MSWSRWAALGFLGALTFLAAVAPERLDTRPSVVDGVQVMTVGQVLGGRAAGQIGGELVAVGGYWSDNVMPTTGMCRGQDTLALGCYDGEFGITEMNEHILLMSKYGELTARKKGKTDSGFVSTKRMVYGSTTWMPETSLAFPVM